MCAGGKSTAGGTASALSQGTASPQQGGRIFCLGSWVRSCRNTAGHRWLLALGRLIPSLCATGKPLQKSSLEITQSVRELEAGIYVLWWRDLHAKYPVPKNGASFSTIPCIETLAKPGTIIHSISSLTALLNPDICGLGCFFHQFYLFSNREFFNSADFCPFPHLQWIRVKSHSELQTSTPWPLSPVHRKHHFSINRKAMYPVHSSVHCALPCNKKMNSAAHFYSCNQGQIINKAEPEWYQDNPNKG